MTEGPQETTRFERTDDGRWRARTRARGRALLTDGLVNRGTAFSEEDRRTFGIDGLVPSGHRTLEVQADNAARRVADLDEPLDKYVQLAALQERNEVLFHRVLFDHVEELLPIVYTPTVGLAAERYSYIHREARALWIHPGHRGRVAEVLRSAAPASTRLLVVTDNERILGLGDQGAGGIVIPIGKLALYTLGAGIHPAETLPVSLDVGTDNQALLDDPAYVGWRAPRLRGGAYDSLVDELVEAVAAVFPQALLQWEDFKKGNAFALLDRYRKRLPSFNDDIQGTASVALAGVMAACRAKGERLRDQRIVMLGAGAAGVGISDLLRDGLSRDGLDGDALVRAVAVLDSRGMLVDRREIGDDYKRRFAWPAGLADAAGLPADRDPSLMDVVRALRPTVLIGTSGTPGAFDETVIRALAAHCERPTVLPFSNPTKKSEAVPADVLAWTDGRALVATGSPFDPVTVGGRTVRIGQGNNVYVFPGIGLGALIAEASEVTDGMFTVAADALAAQLSDDDLAEGALYPRLRRLRELTLRVAAAVVREAARVGVARRDIPDEEVDGAVAAAAWTPAYPELVAD